MSTRILLTWVHKYGLSLNKGRTLWVFPVSYDITASGKHLKPSRGTSLIAAAIWTRIPFSPKSCRQECSCCFDIGCLCLQKLKKKKKRLLKIWLPKWNIWEEKLPEFLGIICAFCTNICVFLWKSRIIANWREMCVSLFQMVLKIDMQYGLESQKMPKLS